MKIKQARINKKITQNELAIKMNVSTNTVSRWERGTVTIPTKKLIKLSEVLEVQIDFLLKGE